jgi:hypothetical protein
MTGFGCIPCSKRMLSVRPDLLVNRADAKTDRIDGRAEAVPMCALWRPVVSALAQTPRLD